MFGAGLGCDLGVVVGQADRHNAIDDRPVDRAPQGPVQRRDEVEAEPDLLGDTRDPRTERREERIREDDREVLRPLQSPGVDGGQLGEVGLERDRLVPVVGAFLEAAQELFARAAAVGREDGY